LVEWEEKIGEDINKYHLKQKISENKLMEKFLLSN
jgi:hypothetical protein